MARAIGKAGDRAVAAEDKLRPIGFAARIIERPAALAQAKLEQRAALRAVDGSGLECPVRGGERRLGGNQAQQMPLRGKPRGPGAGRLTNRGGNERYA